MTPLLTSDQMREIERQAIASGRVTGLELMERAAQVVADEILGNHDALSAGCRQVAVLCGPGNNGGDGYAVADLLAQAGWRVSVWSLGDGAGLSAEAETVRARWLARGQVGRLEEFAGSGLEEGTIVVDALFGTGLRRPIAGPVIQALDEAMRLGPVVAVDIFSGVDSDTGKLLAETGFDPAGAALTVTFQCARPGHCLGRGADLAGRLAVHSIGIENALADLRSRQHLCRLADPQAITSADLAKRDPISHKYDYGHLLVLSGGRGRGGAARLAARSAMRVGAGLVTIGVEDRAIDEHAAQLNAIMLAAIDDEAMLRRFLADSRVNAACAGPGLGTGPDARKLVLRLLQSGRSLVLDADAVGMFHDDPAILADAVSGDVVLTPHAGEFRRLFPDLGRRMDAEVSYSKLDATIAAARRSRATVLFKGFDNVVAGPDGRSVIIPAVGSSAAPWLATAGSGDVLAGLVAGLMARGQNGFAAACLAACLHIRAARQFGPGLMAEDLPEAIPAVLSSLEQHSATG